MIRIQGLHKFFNKGRQNEIHVINDVSLELPERGMVAIFGKSGCGKTTLLNVIGGLDSFADGTLTIEGQDIRRDTDVLRNQYVGYIFQNYNLNKEESCFDNVADALRLCGMDDAAEIESRVMAALANVGMDKYSKRTPDTLSGGQQQRIAIARAIVKNPRIILADEPTGNLDEANTVMIMDLLKAIARDHLVLLVTHEANLVDFYCDTVIELSDGKVVGVKQNQSANGFTVRDKNDIYLGELKQSAMRSENTVIEYYGDTPEEPIRLKVINNGGKLYVQINTPKVQILDDFSEVKLKEGVFEQKSAQNAMSEEIDMSALPPISGSRFGRLFSLKSSIKSGYVANFKNRKKGKKILRGCMCLFAAVLVLMSAVFGTSLGEIINARESYNHHVFYVYTPDGDVSHKLNAAVGDGSTGIDYLRLTYSYPSGDETVSFRVGSFETFQTSYYSDVFRTNAVFLDETMARELPSVAGKKEGLADEELLITTAVADALLEKSSLGHIREYDDLLGLITSGYSFDGRNLRIAGVVDSKEPAVYLSELAMAKYVMGNTSAPLYLASDFGLQTEEGKAILFINSMAGGKEDTDPAVGKSVMIRGEEITVGEISRFTYDYSQWLIENKIEKKDHGVYFEELIATEQPSLTVGSDAFYKALDQAIAERYFEYFDYYYDALDAYLDAYYQVEPNYFELWLASQKDIFEAKLSFIGDVEYYQAIQYRELYGRYPTREELWKVSETLPYPGDGLKDVYMMYEREFNSTYRKGLSSTYNYLLSDRDYIVLSKQIGETDPTALSQDSYYYGDYYKSVSVDMDIAVDYIGGGEICYTLIHTTDPEATEAWLNSSFPDLVAPYEYYPAILTPDGVFDRLVEQNMDEIIAGLITMAVLLVIMSVCMYFIMRSSLLNRIKEVGIYRAIGVSKKNLVFRFLIEALVLATLTVLIGYLLTSSFIFLCLGISPLVESIFFYPLWMAGLMLAVLYALCLFCGTLPILSLLRKTPSAILAKYDI